MGKECTSSATESSSPVAEGSGSTSAAMSVRLEGIYIGKPPRHPWDKQPPGHPSDTTRSHSWHGVQLRSSVTQLNATASIRRYGLVYPLRIDGSELPTAENNVDRPGQIHGDTRLEHVPTCPQIKGC